MKTVLKLCTMLAALTLVATASANSITGRYATITLDGDLKDWKQSDIMYPASQITAGQPLNSTFTNVFVANDANYLYVALQVAAPTSISSNWTYNLYLDTDNSHDSGFTSGWMTGGYDCLAQYGAGGTSYSIHNFSGTSQDTWGWTFNTLIDYSYSSSLIEWAIPRSALRMTNNNQVRMEFNVTGTDVTTPTWANQWESGAGTYTFADRLPSPPDGLHIIDLNASGWTVESSGTYPGDIWLAREYDDSGWGSGTGLFGYTPNPSAYPAIATPLSSGANTCYFRNYFWYEYALDNVFFVMTNYVSDGAVLYLNGKEVRRVRMPAGPVDYNTSATGTASPQGSVDVFLLEMDTIGDNFFQVETHQAPASSADMVFGLSLTAYTNWPVTFLDANLPADRIVDGGNSTTFTTDFIGSAPFGYQWLKDGVAIPGATNKNYTIPVALPSDAGYYALRVSNSVSTNTSRAARLMLDIIEVTITEQPTNQTVLEGTSATFRVTATGSGPITYQWFKDSVAIEGATSATYHITHAFPTQAGSYKVQVTNPGGPKDSDPATLNVTEDTNPFMLAAVTGGGTEVKVKFTRPVDATTAGDPANYFLDGGVTVLSVAMGITPADVTLITSPQALNALYTLSIRGVQDLHNHQLAGANGQKAFYSAMGMDGAFLDWELKTPQYTNDVQRDPAAVDFKLVTLFNDENYIYVHVELWQTNVLFNNKCYMYFDTDNNLATGNSSGRGSELMLQGTLGYQQKNGGFNEGVILDLDYTMGSSTDGINFEYRISRAAKFVDGTPLFTTNTINYHFSGVIGWDLANQIPLVGTQSYTITDYHSPVPPLGPLVLSRQMGLQKFNWTGSGRLQSCDSLTTGSWADVPAAASPYIIPFTGTQRYYRLAQ